jgi:hypothetical protein
MNLWMWPVSLVGILSTAVVCGTDMFFLTIGRPALRLASPSAGTEIMGFFHLFADARMPIWGISAILSNFLLVVLSKGGQRWFYLASLVMLILFVIIYNRLSKSINRLQTEAARTGEKLNTVEDLEGLRRGLRPRTARSIRLSIISFRMCRLGRDSAFFWAVRQAGSCRGLWEQPLRLIVARLKRLRRRWERAAHWWRHLERWR